MSDKQMVRQIDFYLKGELTENEVDQLWTEFLREPKFLRWFEIEVAAREYFLRNEKGGNHPDTTEMNTIHFPGGDTVYKRWIYRVAVILLFIILFQWINTDSSENSVLVSEIPAGEMSAADIYRSVETGYDQFDIEINRGFEAAMSGRTEESEKIFEKLLEENLSGRQSAIANLNSGILYFNRAGYRNATGKFEAVIQSDDLPDYIMEKSWWFLSQSRTWMQEYESAMNAAVRVREYDGIFREDADQLILFLETKQGPEHDR